jgi:cytochrome c-type biogenesis protein CcmH
MKMRWFDSKYKEEINRDKGDRGDDREKERRFLSFSSLSPSSLLSLFNSLVFMPIVIALALLIMLGVRGVAAQTPAPSDDAVNAVARELYCPVCENIPLDVCPTTACAQWRELIRLKLSQGQTKEQIKQYFVAQYGDRVLAEPPQTGLNWLAYGLPPVIFLVGVFLVYRGLRGVLARRKILAVAATAPVKPVETPADPYLARVEEELKRRE